MNLFKSILADDPDPPEAENPRESEQHYPPQSSRKQENRDEAEKVVDDPDGSSQTREDLNSSFTSTTARASAWSFGGLIKTLASRSESVIETYRRDLEEFGSGLKKETELFKEVASLAVKELPASIEVGASVGKTIDGVFKSTAEIISQGKESFLASSDPEPESPDANRSLDSRRYSRFDAQLTTIQNDPKSFTEEPEDLEEYRKWKSEYNLNDKRAEFENLIGENAVVEGVYKRLVPSIVDEDTFWYRYFYRVHKLNQQESVRANLVRRAISIDDEEELSWDVDDDDEQISTVKLIADPVEIAEPVSIKNDELQNESCVIVDENGESKANANSSDKATDTSLVTGSNKNSLSKETEKAEEGLKEVEDAALVKLLKKGGADDQGDFIEQNDVYGQQAVQEEEDFGWDEIEDIESSDEKKVSSHGESTDRADIRKRLAEEDDENLSWDIEDDDDEPVKA